MLQAFHRAAATNSVVNVNSFVQRASINMDSTECDANGRTALSLAAITCAYDTVVCLVNLGASLEHVDCDGRTALHLACLYSGDDIRTIKFLVTAGANVAAVDNDGNTALLLAARDQCSPPAVQWLLEYGCARITDTNSVGTSVWTWVGTDLKAIARCPFKIDIDIPPTTIATTFTLIIKRSITITATSLCEMLRTMALCEAPPESLVEELTPELQRVVTDCASMEEE
jgi:hypothetical protein